MIAPTDPVLSSNSETPMTRFVPEISKEALNDKVIMVVGGANGIGASLVELCCENGANVCIGDIDVARGEQLSKECLQQWPVYSDPALPPKPPRSIFKTVDVTDYQSVLDLFDHAF